ncbi:uncharacterized protein LOC112589110 isoform X2 [Harpegnathos saltator]|uniref:uncharacterized protein LOC112589110 isoform X2 n=1 Tax=Harpegnathos saltator TaxID=610380 RepID=UPI000DBEE706|nr:uncharacterized protein LOC112589110 isoform X2 [Harpegnathos saltator]
MKSCELVQVLKSSKKKKEKKKKKKSAKTTLALARISDTARASTRPSSCDVRRDTSFELQLDGQKEPPLLPAIISEKKGIISVKYPRGHGVRNTGSHLKR